MKVPFDAVYRMRGILMIPPCLFLVFCQSAETEMDFVVWPTGLALFMLAWLGRIWSQTHLHYRLRIRKVLTTTGPYAFVRNPIYIANTTMLLGLTVMSELLWFLPVMLLWTGLVYSMVVRREEANLLDKYAESYATYLRQVPRWIPQLIRAEPLNSAASPARDYRLPSIIAELHCFLWMIPFIAKEVLSRMV